MMFSVPLEIDLGIITVWSGAIANIPPGWFLCDGSNGTPNLTDKFIPSAGPTFAVNDEGGSVNHDHAFTATGHTHSLASGAGFDFPGGGPRRDVFDSVDVTGTTDNASIIPPFYALAYIQFNGV